MIRPGPEGEQLARQIRDELDLGNRPIDDILALVDSLGYDVAVLDSDRDVHGMSVIDPQENVSIIAVVRTNQPMRFRSNVAHELAHVRTGDCDSTAPLDERSPREKRADEFARNLLIPTEGLRKVVGGRSPITEDVLSDVCRVFLVSPQMASIAMERAGIVKSADSVPGQHRNGRDLATRHGWRALYDEQSATSNTVRPPRRLMSRAIEGYRRGAVGIAALSMLSGESVAEMEAEMADAGIEPPIVETAPKPTSQELDDLFGDD